MSLKKNIFTKKKLLKKCVWLENTNENAADFFKIFTLDFSKQKYAE